MLPPYWTEFVIWRDAIPLIVSSIVISFFLAIFVGLNRRRVFKKYFVSIFSVSFLGMTIGLMVGLSKSPAVAAVVPSLLSIFGAMMIYMFGLKKTSHQYLVVLASLGLTLNLFFGMLWGGKLRVIDDTYRSGSTYKLNQLKSEHAVNIQKIVYENQLEVLRKAYKRKKEKLKINKSSNLPDQK